MTDPGAAPVVLVVGATGSQGGAVVDALSARGGVRVRALVRDPSGARAAALAQRGVELVRGDLADQAALVAAMDGVGSLYGVTVPGPEEAAQGRTLVAAAVQARVPWTVLGSVASAPTVDSVPHFRDKAVVERALRATELPAAVLAPTWFYENLLGRRDDVARGELPLALPSDTPLQAVALADIGATAAELLLAGPGTWAGRRLELAADAPTPADMAAALAAATGHSVHHVPVALSDIASADLAAMYAFLADEGYAVDLAAVRAALPGVSLRSFADWAVGAGFR